MTAAGRRVLVANAASGAGDDAGDDLDAWCERHGVERRDPGDDLEGAIGDAAAECPEYVAVYGGDGTLRTAADLLADGDVPLLPVPGGTFNHFARTLGIDDLAAASAALDTRRVESVPIAVVADRDSEHVFLNTCVIGWYPEMVRDREQLRERFPRPIAAAVAFGRHLPRLREFTVEFDGETHRAWLLWAGNGRYGTSLGDVGTRESLDEDVLDIRVALADSRYAKAHLLLDLVRGRLDDHDRLERVVTSSPVSARLGRRTVVAALDAEVVELSPPLTYHPAARRLKVLVAPSTDAAAE